MRRSLPLLGLPFLFLLAGSCGRADLHSDKRVIVFGVDGLDPEMLQERIDRGLCPNFKKIAETGVFRPLQTSWPPQSPVAWSNFITGCNPGKHGLFDFIHVDRRNYGPTSSMSYSDPVGKELSLFGYKFPLSGGEQHLTRAFPAFWEVMSAAGVPCAVWRIPSDFPPRETEATTFPDMGTPDISGKAISGMSFLWTDSLERSAKEGSSYYIIPVHVSRIHAGLAKVETQLYGPDSPKDLDALEAQMDQAREAGNQDEVIRIQTRIKEATRTIAPFTAFVDLNGEAPQLAVSIEDHWGIAPLGGWTDWVPVSFEVVPHLVTVHGWTRFLFKSSEPFEVYASPVQIDPFDPVTPVSTPAEASGDLARRIGPYYTQGFPDAYQSYRSGLLDTGQFVSQSDTVLEERGEMLDAALDRFDKTGGLLFFYVGSLDLRSHMLWHCQDPAHPHREPDDPQFADQLDRIYSQVDGMLGTILDRIDSEPDTLLIVMSDHGFAPFHRKMNVNDWLVREGYLVLKADAASKTGNIWTAEKDADGRPKWDESIVDWSRTRAYCLGFNGIILNRAGREPKGIVTEAQAGPLLDEIRQKLLALKDEDGTRILPRVVTAKEVFSGPKVSLAPDLQLGFNVGYGASDETATGEITGEGVIVDNDSRWSGSHLMDPDLVKGSILVNRRMEFSREPGLVDVTATLYSLFSVEPPEGMDGKALF